MFHKNKKNKECADIPCAKISKLDPEYRGHTCLEEVNLSLIKGQTMQEAERCLGCPSPTCMQRCPVNTNIPTFIKGVERGEFLEAAKTLKETSVLPAVYGRVRPQEKQHESKCVHLKMGKGAIAIGYLGRSAADCECESDNISVPEIAEKGDIRIAVVDSGPTGLSFAGDMAKRGYDVAVFEVLYKIGGVLKYGIPEFRLPNKIVGVEIDSLRRMSIRFEKDCIMGKTISYDDLHAGGFRDVSVAGGADPPNFMNISGENFVGAMSSNECLVRVNLMDAANPESDTPMPQGKRVAMIGGGNTAMDPVRIAYCPGTECTMTIRRRSEEEIPARLEEMKHAREEGVESMTLHNPIEYTGGERGHVKQMHLQKMELDETGVSGRRHPIPIEGTIETIDVDEVVASVGVSPNPLVPRAFGDLEVSKKGTIVVEEDSMYPALGNVYTGGDIVRGGATVILVMGDGCKATAAMNADLRG